MRKKKTRDVEGSKGLSELVTTVLLVVIAIIGVSIISAFLIPFVQESPEKSGDCFTARDHLSFSSRLGDVETCWNSSSDEVVLVVKRSQENVEVNGFVISLAKPGQSKIFEIIEGRDHPDVTTIYWKGFSDPYYNTLSNNETIVEKGSEFTYYINTTSISPVIGADISPILRSGEPCPITDFIELEPC